VALKTGVPKRELGGWEDAYIHHYVKQGARLYNGNKIKRAENRLRREERKHAESHVPNELPIWVVITPELLEKHGRFVQKWESITGRVWRNAQGQTWVEAHGMAVITAHG
jgi:hypothetical protein